MKEHCGHVEVKGKLDAMVMAILADKSSEKDTPVKLAAGPTAGESIRKLFSDAAIWLDTHVNVGVTAKLGHDPRVLIWDPQVGISLGRQGLQGYTPWPSCADIGLAQYVRLLEELKRVGKAEHERANAQALRAYAEASAATEEILPLTKSETTRIPKAKEVPKAKSISKPQNVSFEEDDDTFATTDLEEEEAVTEDIEMEPLSEEITPSVQETIKKLKKGRGKKKSG